MKNILQIITLVFFLKSVVFATDFREVFKISLKKDEQTKILVKYADKKRLFEFRWTLYINEGLVTLYKYDGWVAQNVLSLNHKNQSLRIKLRDDGKNFYNPPYILLKFKAFDLQKRKAKFELYWYDPKMQTELKFLKK